MPEPEALLTELRDAGAHDDAICMWLDALIDFEAVVPGPAGMVLEAADEEAWRHALRAVRKAGERLKEWHQNPDRRRPVEEWLAGRKAKRQARQEG